LNSANPDEARLPNSNDSDPVDLDPNFLPFRRNHQTCRSRESTISD
jgi:hypothetical protein